MNRLCWRPFHEREGSFFGGSTIYNTPPRERSGPPPATVLNRPLASSVRQSRNGWLWGRRRRTGGLPPPSSTTPVRAPSGGFALPGRTPCPPCPRGAVDPRGVEIYVAVPTGTRATRGWDECVTAHQRGLASSSASVLAARGSPKTSPPTLPVAPVRCRRLGNGGLIQSRVARSLVRAGGRSSRRPPSTKSTASSCCGLDDFAAAASERPNPSTSFGHLKRPAPTTASFAFQRFDHGRGSHLAPPEGNTTRAFPCRDRVVRVFRQGRNSMGYEAEQATTRQRVRKNRFVFVHGALAAFPRKNLGTRGPEVIRRRGAFFPPSPRVARRPRTRPPTRRTANPEVSRGAIGATRWPDHVEALSRPDSETTPPQWWVPTRSAGPLTEILAGPPAAPTPPSPRPRTPTRGVGLPAPGPGAAPRRSPWRRNPRNHGRPVPASPTAFPVRVRQRGHQRKRATRALQQHLRCPAGARCLRCFQARQPPTPQAPVDRR